ncbi:zinc finger, CCHC-type containing protein [Tanacetum coccineum]
MVLAGMVKLKKQVMVEALVLKLPNFNELYIIETDASHTGIREVLQQGGHSVAYYSKTLATRHHTPSTYEKELLAVIQSLNKWRGYLLDRHFKIKTDQFSLKYLLEQRINTPSQMKWLLKLMGFDYDILYKTGSENKAADALYRIPTSAMVVTQEFKQLSRGSLDCVIGESSDNKLKFLWLSVRLSKYAHFVPLSHPFTTAQIAQVFLDNVYKLHGLPKCLVDAMDRTLVAREAMIQLLKFHLEKAQNRMKAIADAKRTDREFEVDSQKGGGPIPNATAILPQCNEEGEILSVPVEVLDRRLGKVGNAAQVFVLIKWSNAAAAMSVVYVLTTPILEDSGDDPTVEQNVESSKELWDSYEAKYMAEDASSKKFLVTNFTNYKMTDSRLVMEQYNELLGILGGFTQHKMNMDEAIQDELTLVELGSHLRIEESLRALNIVNDNIASTFMSTSKLNDSILWNARLGHVHFKRMQDMFKDGLIPTFDMDTEKCKTCMLTKITKKPFQNVKRKTEVLELIHSDLCDLHATPSLGNKKYFVTFIDDASRFCYVYLLHTKDEALDKFKVFKTKVELLQGSQIKRFRTDRGGEYMDTLYFQPVGFAVVVVRLPDPKLKTLGERGIECIFVGYDEHSKAFRFYVIEPNDSVLINSIIESRDAIFDENGFSSVPRPSLKIPNGTEYIGGSVVPKEVTEEVVQQPEPELRKAKGIGLQRILGLNFNYI